MNIYGYKERGKRLYRYDKRVSGVRLARRGFKTRQAAQDALNEAIEQQKKKGKINSDFVRLCEGHLKDIESRCGKQQFHDRLRAIKRFLKHYGKAEFPTSYDILEFLQVRKDQCSANSFRRVSESMTRNADLLHYKT